MARKKSMTARRAAAMLIHQDIGRVYYWAENAEKGISPQLEEDIARAIADLMEPFEERLANLYDGLDHEDLDAFYEKHLTPEARVTMEVAKLYEDRWKANMTEGAYYRASAAIHKKHGVPLSWRLEEKLDEFGDQP
jgi:hypothetical protein